MTPKEKAEELFEKYFNIIDNSHPLTDINISAKQCASIAVDEIIEELAESADDEVKFMRIIYWERVKREINNL
jgi:hypothetical protein